MDGTIIDVVQISGKLSDVGGMSGSLSAVDGITGTVTLPTVVESNKFVVTLTWDEDYFGDDGAWMPDKTAVQIHDAFFGGKEIIFIADGGNPTYWFMDDDYAYVYGVYMAGDGLNAVAQNEYMLTPQGVEAWGSERLIYPSFDSPTKAYTPSDEQQFDTITFDENVFNGIQSVQVIIDAIPNNYGLVTWNGSTLTVS